VLKDEPVAYEILAGLVAFTEKLDV